MVSNIYIYALLFTWKSKKQFFFAVALPSAMTIALGKAGKIAATISQAIALGKENKKKMKKCFDECLGSDTRQRKF